MAKIHPTAVIDPGAQLADDVEVGPFCYVGPQVTLGPGTRLVAHVTLLNRTTLGKNNIVWPQATLGALPQDLKYHGEESTLIIGDHNDIRESVSMHIGTTNGGGFTRVGSHNLFMVGSHVAHDCVIGDHVLMANNVLLAGHIHVEDHALLSGATAVHHFVTIGRYAFLGGMTRVVHDVPPYMIYEGNPAKVRGVNVIGLERNHFSAEGIAALKEAYRRLFRGEGAAGNSASGVFSIAAKNPEQAKTTMLENLAQIEAEYPKEECIRSLIDFLRNKNVGKFGRFRENQRTDNRHHNPAR